MDASNINDFIPVPIGEFLSGSKVPVDLYVRLSEEKFVLVVKAGSETQLDRLRKYSEKDLHHFYVPKDQYAAYVDQNLNIAGILVETPKLSSSQKTSLLAKSTNAVFQEIETLGVSPQAFSHVRQVSDSMVRLVDAKPDFNSLLSSLNSLPGDLVKHSVAVSILSAMLGQEMGWEKKGTLEKLALGGLLHDIGKKELPPDILTKTRAQMSFEEVVLYESHPYRGMQLLQSIPTVPEDILAIAYEHHEIGNGQGFPRRLRDMKMHPLARVVSLANCFIDLTLASPLNAKPRSGREAVQYIDLTMGNPFNKEAMNALKAIIKRDSKK